MPMKSLKPCRHPGCPELTSDMYCTKHAPLYQRESAHSRGYNSKWRRLSKLYLKAHPLCCECKRQSKLTPATVVDHIVPHRGNQKLMWDESNWQSLCKRCHDRKTARFDRTPTYGYKTPLPQGGLNLKTGLKPRPRPPFVRIFAKLTGGDPLRNSAKPCADCVLRHFILPKGITQNNGKNL